MSYIKEQWCKRQGCRECKCLLKIFDLSKIQEKYLKILEIPGKMALHVFWLQKNGAQLWKNARRPFFGGHIKTFCFWNIISKLFVFGISYQNFLLDVISKKVFMIFVRKFVGKSRTKTFRASLGEIGQKSFKTPKICLLLHLWSKV